MGRMGNAVRSGAAQDKAHRKKPRLNRDEREFQAAAIEILETPASPAARILAALIMVFAAGAIAWSWFGRIETHAEVQGKVIPVGRVQVIEPLVTATVKAIHVEGGQAVQQGDLLVELDPTEFAAERRKLADNLALARVSAARLRATLDAVAAGTPAEDATFVRPTDASYGFRLIPSGTRKQTRFRAARAPIRFPI